MDFERARLLMSFVRPVILVDGSHAYAEFNVATALAVAEAISPDQVQIMMGTQGTVLQEKLFMENV